MVKPRMGMNLSLKTARTKNVKSKCDLELWKWNVRKYLHLEREINKMVFGNDGIYMEFGLERIEKLTKKENRKFSSIL